MRVGGLDAHYRKLQARWASGSNADYEQLVVPNGNGGAPVHRWFRMKEAYSRDLLKRVIKDTDLAGSDELHVLDPYAGAGTTGVSLAELVQAGDLRQATFHGVESNPFLHLATATKVDVFRAPPSDFDELAQRVGAVV